MAIENMFDRQVLALADKVRRLQASGGKEPALYESIRKQVSGELINQGKLEVVAATIGELCLEEGACQSLTDLVTHCSQHFYLEDRVLSAFVLPVAFRIKGPLEAPVLVSRGDADSIASLALMIKCTTGARAVWIDPHLFDKSLFYASARQVHDHLRQLETGDKHPMAGLRPVIVRSATEPEWQMLYFLGVQVTDLNSPRLLEDPAVQRNLANWTYHATDALTQCREVLFNRNVKPQAQNHGIWYLNRGIFEGENAMRGHRLQSMLANFDQGVKGVKFFYTHVLAEFQVKLLICSHLLAVEFVWKLLGAETMDGFRAALNHAIRMEVPAKEVLELCEVSQFEYQRLAKEHGLDWMMEAMQ